MKKIVFWALLTIPIIIWQSMTPLADRFGSLTMVVKSFGQISGLLGMSLMGIVIILSSRLPEVEKYLLSLDKAYKNHHLLGGIAFILLMAHPLFLAFSYVSSSLYLAATFLLPTRSRIDILTGEISLFLMMGLLITTFFHLLKYPIWKLTHKFLNLAFFFAVIHTLIVTSDISNNLILKTYYIILIFVVGLALVYKNLMIEKYSYKLIKVNKLNSDITELLLEPVASKMPYLSGQFVFLEIKDTLFSNEAHPFSIASSPKEKFIRLVIKNLGDYTSQINLLKGGVIVNLEGPYGHFSTELYKTNDFVWIAGGIGITPFVGMANDLKGGQKADLYYSFSKKEEEVFGNCFLELSKQNSDFRYCSHLTEEKGRLTVDHILEKSGSLNNKIIFICGSKPMMESFKIQFMDKGISSDKIINEDFGF